MKRRKAGNQLLWTWVLICLITGELLLYLILTISKTFLPHRVAPPIRSQILFYILCLGLFVMGGISFFSYADTQERLRDLDTIYDQIVGLADVGDTMMLMESNQRGFLITGNQGYLDPYDKLKETIDRKMEAIKNLYRETPDQVRVNAFGELVKNRVILLDKNIEIKKQGKQEEVEKNMDEGKNVMNMIVISVRDLQERRVDEYRRIMSGLRALGSVRVYMSFTLMVAALVQIGIAAVLGRSRRSAPSSEPAAGEIFFHKEEKN